MLPDTGAESFPHLARLQESAAAGIQQILDFAGHMQTVTERLPDELKPTGQALTDISMRMLTQTYAETLMLYSELGLQEITRAALPPNHHAEKEE